MIKKTNLQFITISNCRKKTAVWGVMDCIIYKSGYALFYIDANLPNKCNHILNNNNTWMIGIHIKKLESNKLNIPIITCCHNPLIANLNINSISFVLPSGIDVIIQFLMMKMFQSLIWNVIKMEENENSNFNYLPKHLIILRLSGCDSILPQIMSNEYAGTDIKEQTKKKKKKLVYQYQYSLLKLF